MHDGVRAAAGAGNDDIVGRAEIGELEAEVVGGDKAVARVRLAGSLGEMTLRTERQKSTHSV